MANEFATIPAKIISLCGSYTITYEAQLHTVQIS